jgi:hypothetical protein
VGGLQVAQLAYEQVEVPVGDLGVVENVIPVVVVGDELTQLGHAGGDLLDGWILGRRTSFRRSHLKPPGRTGWRRLAR